MEAAGKEKEKTYFRSQPMVHFHEAVDQDPKDIFYKLFTNESPDKEIILTEENVASHNLAKDVKTILIIHGWTNDDLGSPWYHPLKEAYFQHGSYNIIYINWSAYANFAYGISCAYVKPVGAKIAKFLEKSDVPADKIHLIGHSLGAQLAGFIGKAYENVYGKKIGRITALDPAGPKWSSKDMKKEEILNESDASFVDVIHTDIQFYGYTNPCGHVDFYPNGGTNQPGCPDKEQKGNCNHQRSAWFFIESINKQSGATEINFKEDENYNIVITPIENAKKIIFGEHVNLEDRGAYTLKTNSTRPFLI